MGKESELINTQDMVYDALVEDEQARRNDNHLYWVICEAVAKKNGIDLDSMNLKTFLHTSARNGFPAFETVRRSRQRMQALHPWLQADKTIAELRKENEEIFRKVMNS